MQSPLLTAEVLQDPRISVVSCLKELRAEAGNDLIDLSIGNPDLPPCREAIDELLARSAEPGMHGYGSLDGQPQLIDSIRRYYRTRYGVTVAQDEINVVRGTRNLLFSIAYLFAAPGDGILLPSIGYQSYYLATIFNRCTPYYMPMTEENGFVPDPDDIDLSALERARVLYLNFPCNPVGSTIPREKLARFVELCNRHDILLCYDNAYNEIVFDGAPPVSLLEIPGAKEIGVEVTSMSKLTSLAGWRIAFCASSPEISRYIWKYNAVTDSAVYNGFQFAGARALDYVTEHDDGKRLAAIYEARRDIALAGLSAAGIRYVKPQGGFYVWLRVPAGMTDVEFVKDLSRACKVLLMPGSYYGEAGVHFARLSLTASPDTLSAAAERIAKRLFS